MSQTGSQRFKGLQRRCVLCNHSMPRWGQQGPFFRTHLLVVDYLPLEFFHHLSLSDAVVMYDRVFDQLQTMHFSRNRLEERATARARSPQNDEQLTTFHQPVEISNDLFVLFVPEVKSLVDAQR